MSNQTQKPKGSKKPSGSPIRGDKNGSVEMKIPQTIRYQIEDPFNFLNMGGTEVIEKTITAFSEEATRSIVSKIEYDTVMGLNVGIGKLVTACLKHPTQTVDLPKISPSETLFEGILYLCGGCVVFGVIPFMFFNMSILTLLFIFATMIAFLLAGLKEIPKKHVGVQTKFDKRYKVYYDEGVHWVLWPIYGFEVVDMRERIIELKEGEKVIRVVAGNAPDASNSLPDEQSVANLIDREFKEKSGVNVLQVIFGEITPVNEALLRAREKEIEEKAKSAGEQRDMEAQSARISDLIKKGVDPTEAARMVQSQEGNLTRTEVIVNGAGDLDKLVGAVVAGAMSVKEAKQAGQEKKGGKK